MKLPKNRVPITASLPFDFLAEVDELAYSQGRTRSDFILEALQEKMERIKKENESK